jgi:hypothetical protein
MTRNRYVVRCRTIGGVDPEDMPRLDWIDDLERRAESAASGIDPEWLWWLEREISPITQK